jgi:hypothetical protein
MSPTIATTLARLPHLTVEELRAMHAEVIGAPTASRHKTWLVRRIAWRVQANAEGGLTERALARAAELSAGQQLRERRPVEHSTTAGSASKVVPIPVSRGPNLAPGTVLRRAWKGTMHLVTAQQTGFEHDGRRYTSLSAIASAITGTKWNGLVFFGLKSAHPTASPGVPS